MAAHNELVKQLDRCRATYSNATATSTIAAANATLDAKTIEELQRAAKVVGYEMVLNAGAVVFQPKS